MGANIMSKCKYFRQAFEYPHLYCEFKYQNTRDGKIDSETFKKYCEWDRMISCPIYSKYHSSTDDCFLTTACTNAKGLPDDCRELTVLRAFRDGYLSDQDYGKDEISEYYRIAPAIVDAINSREFPCRIWEELYVNLVTPCVRFIEEDKNEEAHELYRTWVKNLSAEYLNKD